MVTKIIKYTFYGLITLAGVITIIEAIKETSGTMTYVTKRDIKAKGAQVFHIKVHIKKDKEAGEKEEHTTDEKNT